MEIEAQFGSNSATSALKRTEELKRIVRDFLLFKRRLECQADSYHFEVYRLNTPFDREWMSSLNGLDAPDSKVEYTISPTLYKLVKPNSQVVIERARVKLISPPGRPETGEVEISAEKAEESTERLSTVLLSEILNQQHCGETDEEQTKSLVRKNMSMLPNETPKQPIEQSSQQTMDQQPREETYGKEANNSTDEHFAIPSNKPLETASEECDEEEL